MQREIYLDNSATTRICDEALEKYVKTSKECWGNPSSLHGMGFIAEGELKAAREAVIRSLGATGSTVIFCASGSEANNLAIIGRATAKERYKRGAKIITTMGEHASVEKPLAYLESQGYKIAYIPTVGGEIDMATLERELTRDVILVTMMMVNNETGALYDTVAVGRMMRQRCPDAALHVDATQSYMKFPFTKATSGADMITVSSHKIEGPKGVGALVVDKEIMKKRDLAPMVLGGGQEGGLRSGTENVPAVAAFGEAVRIAEKNVRANYSYVKGLRDYLIAKLEGEIPEISITKPKKAAPHILNITLPKIKSETMLHFLSSYGIYVSSGSACSSNSNHGSSALVAFGRSAEEADFSVRVSFSHRNTSEDVDALVDALKIGLEKLSRVR